MRVGHAILGNVHIYYWPRLHESLPHHLLRHLRRWGWRRNGGAGGGGS
jgi:hypothetical protein